jgi:hypothetical protein
MLLSRSLAQILVVLTLTSVIIPNRPAEAIIRIGNSRTTTFKVSDGKLVESRVGNGRTIERVQSIRKISGHLVGNGLWSDPRKPLVTEKLNWFDQ